MRFRKEKMMNTAVYFSECRRYAIKKDAWGDWAPFVMDFEHDGGRWKNIGGGRKLKEAKLFCQEHANQ